MNVDAGAVVASSVGAWRRKEKGGIKRDDWKLRTLATKEEREGKT